MLMDPREFWSGLDQQSRLLAISVGASIVFHAVLLTLHFRFPDSFDWKAANQPLEVMLVNSKSREKSDHARALAQSNLDGGGNTADRRHASSPLPVTNPREPGRRTRSCRPLARDARAAGEDRPADARVSATAAQAVHRRQHA
jgi:protein TonB